MGSIKRARKETWRKKRIGKGRPGEKYKKRDLGKRFGERGARERERERMGDLGRGVFSKMFH